MQEEVVGIIRSRETMVYARLLIIVFLTLFGVAYQPRSCTTINSQKYAFTERQVNKSSPPTCDLVLVPVVRFSLPSTRSKRCGCRNENTRRKGCERYIVRRSEHADSTRLSNAYDAAASVPKSNDVIYRRSPPV